MPTGSPPMTTTSHSSTFLARSLDFQSDQEFASPCGRECVDILELQANYQCSCSLPDTCLVLLRVTGNSARLAMPYQAKHVDQLIEARTIYNFSLPWPSTSSTSLPSTSSAGKPGSSSLPARSLELPMLCT